MIASYGEISGFSAIGTEELVLVNGGKGSSGGGGGGSSYSTAVQNMHPANQAILGAVSKDMQTAGTAFVEAVKVVAKGALTAASLAFPPAVAIVYNLLNPGTASHTTLH
jgi:hypothetical protein